MIYGDNMKLFFVIPMAVLAAGFVLAACGIRVPAEQSPEAAATTVLAPTSVDPTSASTPSMVEDPSPTPTANFFTGTAVSFDRLGLVVPDGVAAGGSGTIVPEATGDGVAPWDVAPEHIQFLLEGYVLAGKFHQPQIYAYPAEAYARLQERGSAAQSLEQLRAVLAQSSMVNVNELPSVPFFNVPQALAAQLKVVPFQNGRGVRMITQYAMGRAIINNGELIYHFEGLTDDGQTYVIAILPITAPGLPEDGQPGGVVPPSGVPLPDFNDMNADWMGYYGNVRQMLQDLEPGSFYPVLDQLDLLIESLTISAAN